MSETYAVDVGKSLETDIHQAPEELARLAVEHPERSVRRRARTKLCTAYAPDAEAYLAAARAAAGVTP